MKTLLKHGTLTSRIMAKNANEDWLHDWRSPVRVAEVPFPELDATTCRMVDAGYKAWKERQQLKWEAKARRAGWL